MLEVFLFVIDNLLNIMIVSILFLGLLVLFTMLNGDISNIKDKPIEKIVTIESMV